MQLRLFPEPSLFRRTYLIALRIAIVLRSQRARWNTRLRPYILLLVTPVVFLALLNCFLIFGAGAVLPLLSDLVPILIAIIGIILSYRQPKKESHAVVTLILAVAGLTGSGILSWTRMLNERTHKDEVMALERRIESVGKTNGEILRAVLAPPKIDSSEEFMGEFRFR